MPIGIVASILGVVQNVKFLNLILETVDFRKNKAVLIDIKPLLFILSTQHID